MSGLLMGSAYIANRSIHVTIYIYFLHIYNEMCVTSDWALVVIINHVINSTAFFFSFC